MLIDTHAHLYLEEFDVDRDAMIQRAEGMGVGKFYLPNIDSSSIDPMLKLEKEHPGQCFPMMGLHPCSVKENYEQELALIEKWLATRHFCAIGETGIDLYWDASYIEEQKIAFRRQIQWAKELGIPVIIHSRESTEHILEMLEAEQDGKLYGILHCFTGTSEQANRAIDLGFWLGIGGVLTFKNAGLDKTVRQIPLEYLVLETDSPYLAPVPYRGKRNESAYIRLVAEKLAELKETNLAHVSAVTSSNAEKIFHKKNTTHTTLS